VESCGTEICSGFELGAEPIISLKTRVSRVVAPVRTVLEPNGVYLVCDHVVGPEGMTNTELYMTSGEQHEALHAAGFGEVKILLEKKGLALYRAIQAT
jgi:predicted methyltransferase